MSFSWDEVWNRKASTDTMDPLALSGFESFPDFDSQAAAARLIELMGIKEEDTVFEIGAGAALLGRHLKNYCHYIASDRSQNMVLKSIAINGFEALRCDADDLPFKDKFVDHVFAFTIFQYFPDHAYAQRCLKEMERVARKSICISDIPTESHEKNHLLYTPEFFAGFAISPALYAREHHRFTATKLLAK